MAEINREKVIRGLEISIISDTDAGFSTIEIPAQQAKNILTLLKEQEVVRCKDCKHGGECVKPYKDYWCHLHDFYQYGNWFCADGERKEGR